jgi:hypothetical protein
MQLPIKIRRHSFQAPERRDELARVAEPEGFPDLTDGPILLGVRIIRQAVKLPEFLVELPFADLKQTRHLRQSDGGIREFRFKPIQQKLYSLEPLGHGRPVVGSGARF